MSGAFNESDHPRNDDGTFAAKAHSEPGGGTSALTARNTPPRGASLYRIVQEDAWTDSVSREGFRAGSEYWHTLEAALRWADEYEATTGVACRVMEIATPPGATQTDDPRGTSFVDVPVPVSAMRVARTFDGEIPEAPACNDDATKSGEVLTFDQVIEAAGVTDRRLLANCVRDLCGIDPTTARFRLTTLSLDDVQGWGSAPEDYLVDGDDEGYETVASLTDAYSSGEDVPPVVIGNDRYITDGTQVLDGCHRIGAARAAGLSELPAFEVVTRGGAQG